MSRWVGGWTYQALHCSLSLPHLSLEFFYGETGACSPFL